MSAFLSACIHLNPLAIVQAGGYLGIAILVFAESGLLIGIFFPGDSLLFVAGLLSAGGFLAFSPLVLIVICAAIIGDSTGYWFGAKIGPALFKRRRFAYFLKKNMSRERKNSLINMAVAQSFSRDSCRSCALSHRFSPASAK